MKIVTANGKKQIKISKKEWEGIGKKAGWEGSKDENVLNDVILDYLVDSLRSKIESMNYDSLENLYHDHNNKLPPDIASMLIKLINLEENRVKVLRSFFD